MSEDHGERVIISRPGGRDRLRVERFAPRAPGAGEVRVRARACGVNYADCIARMGLYASAYTYEGYPLCPGFEAAGEVEALGSGVNDLELGARVIAVTRFGGYATHVVLPRSQIFALPRAWSFEQGAAFPAVAMTAWWALHELANVREGRRVLVHSAAGGVGAAVLAQARAAGCECVGVVGTRAKIDVARALGATHVIVRERGWETAARERAPRGYDVVLDANGADTLRASYRLLGAPGKLVVYGFASMMQRGADRPSWPRLAWSWLRTPRFDPLRLTNDNKSVLAFNLSYLFEQQDALARAMGALLAQVARGELGPPPITTFPLARAADAHAAIESGTTTGKLVLRA